MTDTITIEVDGELDGPEHLRQRGRPRWGMPVAVALVALLIAGLVWTFASTGGSQAAAPPVTTPQVTTPVASSVPATTVAPATPSTSAPAAVEPEPDLADPLVAARAALSAWGEFAGTGDLTAVEPYFASDGPQMQQLQGEAARIDDSAAARPYSVSITDPLVATDGGSSTVEAAVTWSRAGEADQAYHWAVELRLVGGRWRLWTVRTIDG